MRRNKGENETGAGGGGVHGAHISLVYDNVRPTTSGRPTTGQRQRRRRQHANAGPRRATRARALAWSFQFRYARALACTLAAPEPRPDGRTTGNATLMALLALRVVWFWWWCGSGRCIACLHVMNAYTNTCERTHLWLPPPLCVACALCMERLNMEYIYSYIDLFSLCI